MPGINDAPEQIAPILELASEAGAAYVTGIALHLRGEVRGLFFDGSRHTGRTSCRATSGCTSGAPMRIPTSAGGCASS